MVKMHLYGITITCTEKEVDFFKRAGYSVVEVEKPAEPEAPVQPVIVVEPDAPKSKAKK